jgi:uncharacterized SAM-binding protein YcdF (DUF218 family)
MGWGRRAARLALLVFAIGVGLAWLNREVLLRRTGTFLLAVDAVAKADVAVVVRGDEIRFDRAMKVAALVREGWTDRVYVSSALADPAARALAAKGVVLPSTQDDIVSVLMQRGVACERIVVDASPPGGGTEGEMRRLRAFMSSRGLKSALLVTSWFHTRRVKRSAAAILPEFRLAVLASDDEEVAQRWWRQRYVAQTVVEEYGKLMLAKLAISPHFADDPPSEQAPGGVGPPAQCAGADVGVPSASATP